MAYPVKQRKKRFNGVNNPSGYAFGFDPTRKIYLKAKADSAGPGGVRSGRV